jgi:hypothetical protein
MAPSTHLEVVTGPLVNHAMAHNGIRVVRRITLVAAESPAPALSDVVITARLVDAHGTVLTRPWQHHVDRLESGSLIRLDTPDLALDPAAIASIEEETGADLVVEATAEAGQALVTSRTPLRVLAARQWLVDPDSPVLSLELLAAFVQPNHAALGPIVARAAAYLDAETTSGSLAVDHVLPGRIDAIVEAVCAAVHEAGIYYAQPPASWGYGQKVRSPGDVLEQKIGTCLDTTLLVASALEHLGIHPVLWIVRGHAFVGYWRTPDTGLPDAASLQCAQAVNAVGLGLMGVVETTMLTVERRPPKDLFRRAAQAPLDTYLHGDPAALVGVVDVHLARIMRVFPVPARRTREDGVVEVVEYRPATPREDSLGAQGDARDTLLDGIPASDSPTAGPDSSVAVRRPEPPPRVQAWKNALLDLTLRNKLLNSARGVTQLPLLLPGEHLGSLADHLAEGKPVAVRAADDLAGAVLAREARDAYALPADVLRTMLRDKATVYAAADTDTHRLLVARLRYRARTGLQETGANPLALTLGRLDWKLGDRDLTAPLLLAPVELKGIAAPFKIVADETSGVTLNLSLLEKLRVEFGFVVPGLAELPVRPAGSRGEGGVDVDEVVRRVRQALLDAGLPFTVETEARLAIVGFTGYLLWRDLDEHWERFLAQPVARHLALTPTARFTDPAAAAEVDTSIAALDGVVADAPIPADGSQAEAVAYARAGRTFVLEGPPGTGKSQTITNILADQVARGRRVLFVAEKGAALDVVRRRLAEIGLSPFALDLHDEHATPAQVRERLRAAIAHVPRPDEAGFRAAANDVTSSAATLAAYAARLHEPNIAGFSAYSAHAQLLAHGPGPVAHVAAASVSAQWRDHVDLYSCRRAVANATGLLASLGETGYRTWGFATSLPADLPGFAALVESTDHAMQDLDRRLAGCQDSVRAAVATALTSSQLDQTGWCLTSRSVSPLVLDETRSRRWLDARADLDARLARLDVMAAPVQAVLDPAVVTVALEPVRLAIREAAASFFIGRKGRLVVAAAPILAHARPGAVIPPKTLPVLVEQVAAVAAEAVDLAHAWNSLPGLGSFPADANLLAPQGRSALAAVLVDLDRDRAILASLLSNQQDAVREARAAGGVLLDEVYAVLHTATERLSEVVDATGTPRDTINGPDRAWSTERGILAAWLDSSSARLADLGAATMLRRWAEVVQLLDPLHEHGFPMARRAFLCGAIPAAEVVGAFERGLAEAALKERLAGEALTAFDSDSLDRVVGRFVAASHALRGTLRAIIPDRVVQGRPFRPGASFGTVAALEREVGRTRGGLSVRRLMQTFGEVIGELTPCVLVSPDSLARFIPPGSIDFDLVVFDEASQITVPDAVGALGRARAAVIAGDSKQMPPSRFGESIWDEWDAAEDLAWTSKTAAPLPPATPAETTDPPGADVVSDTSPEDFRLLPDEESILSELVHSGVHRLWLSWHYRSQDESLIAFSNGHYYDDRLSSFPAYPGELADTGVSFTRVDGTFHRSARRAAVAGNAGNAGNAVGLAPAETGPSRTNPIEAAAVVAEVRRRWDQGERSIGVVTFNLQQRTLIERLLWEIGDESIADSLARGKDGLFVKNLENVQGDERDVIIFSTAFAKTAAGVLPLNFGPLNRLGGERRLNVAITRARRRVMVFSSFDPEDLRVEQTSSVGIKHLRAYLELAKYGVGGPPASPATVGAAALLVSGGDAPAQSAQIQTVDRHREDIATQLRAEGLAVHTSVGLSDFKVDLAVGPPGQPPCLAILLDGPDWAARRTTNDRDGLPATVLHDIMGWPMVMRIWLPGWLAARTDLIATVCERAELASRLPRRVGERRVSTAFAASSPQDAPEPHDRATDVGTGAGPASPAVVPADHDTPQDGVPRRWSGDPARDPIRAAVQSEPYEPFVPRHAGRLAVLDGSANAVPRHVAAVQDVIRRIVQTEGPVSPERLALLTARCFGLVRPPRWRIDSLLSILPVDLRRDPEEGFLWPDGRDPMRWRGFRTWEGTLKDRPLEEIPLVEIGNALIAIARSAMGIEVDDLLRQTLKIFNGSRLTDAPRKRLMAALRVAQDRGQLVVTGTIVTATDD